MDFADIFVWMKASTNSGHGNWYAVSCPAAASPPTGAQIVAGTDGSGNPCSARKRDGYDHGREDDPSSRPYREHRILRPTSCTRWAAATATS